MREEKEAAGSTEGTWSKQKAAENFGLLADDVMKAEKGEDVGEVVGELIGSRRGTGNGCRMTYVMFIKRDGLAGVGRRLTFFGFKVREESERGVKKNWLGKD